MTAELNKRDEKRADKRARQSSRPRYQSDSEFINRELTKEEQADYREWRNDLDGVLAEWSELLEGGYRVNTKYDDYSSAFACFIIPPDDGDNSGFILTGRGGNPYRAVSEAVFKHSEIFHGVWHSMSASSALRDDPDF